MPKPRPDRPMKVAEWCNLHNYFIRLQPPLSETSKQILEEIEEHLLTVVKEERSKQRPGPSDSGATATAIDTTPTFKSMIP